MHFNNQGSAEGGFLADMVPDVAEQLAWGALESREKVEAEIDLMLRTMRTFWELEPDHVMRFCGALSARCSELAVHLHRLEGRRDWKQIRTMQVDRCLAELDRQFKLASRMIEVRRQDIETSR
jgi:hypothetical protein